MESTSTLIVALVGAGVSLTVAVLGHRRSKAVDAISAQSGVASNHRAGTQQLIEGLNGLVDQLQEENNKLRIEAGTRAVEANDRAARLDAMTLEVARLRKKYADNGNDTPNPPTKEKPK